MASSADNYQDNEGGRQERLQHEIAERASASGHPLGGPGTGDESLSNNRDSQPTNGLNGEQYGQNGRGDGLSREPSYVDNNGGSEAYPQEKGGRPLSEFGNGTMHKVRTIEGEPQANYDDQRNSNGTYNDADAGREYAQVVDHDQFNQIVSNQPGGAPRELFGNNGVQPGQVYPYEQQQGSQRQLPYQEGAQDGFRPDMQPSRSYVAARPESTYQQQQQQSPAAGFAGVGSGQTGDVNPDYDQRQQSLQHGQQLSSFPATGALVPQRQSTFQPQQPVEQYQQQPQQTQLQNIDTGLERKNTNLTTGTAGTAGAIAVGTTRPGYASQGITDGQTQHTGLPTASSPTSAQNYNQQIPDIRALSSGTSAAASPVAGGGLGAAIASSGHNLQKGDKKALKSEIKTEKNFEKSLGSQAKAEARSIDDAIKMAKLSAKAAEKSGKHELGYRKSYDRAVKDEVKMKERLLKITSEYNKVAAELEKATKEMEIRKNSHQADLETRDADARRVDELRKAKGVHDMEREALHGESLTKQAQAKRALSVRGRPKSTAF